MALNANALVTLEEAKAFLGNVGGADDERLRVVINRASEFAEGYCNRPLARAVYTNLRLKGPCAETLYLPNWPIDIAQTLTVTISTEVQTVWKQESDGDPATFDVLVGSSQPEKPIGQRDHLWRANGWAWGGYRTPYNVLLTYTGGYGGTGAGTTAMPEDLKLAACLVIQKMWQDTAKQLTDVTTINGPFGSVNILDLVLPRQARDILTYYRVVPL